MKIQRYRVVTADGYSDVPCINDPSDDGDFCYYREVSQEIDRLKTIITSLGKLAMRPHDIVDMDGWYSCPSSGECLDKDREGCDCGADEHNKKVADILKEII